MVTLIQNEGKLCEAGNLEVEMYEGEILKVVEWKYDLQLDLLWSHFEVDLKEGEVEVQELSLVDEGKLPDSYLRIELYSDIDLEFHLHLTDDNMDYEGWLILVLNFHPPIQNVKVQFGVFEIIVLLDFEIAFDYYQFSLPISPNYWFF